MMRVGAVLLATIGLAAVAEASPSQFRPVFGFPYLLGKKDGKGGEKAALEDKVLPVTPTRFEYQRACYVFIYDTLQKHRNVMSEPAALKETVMHNCVQDDKADCEKWAGELVSVLEKKEDEEKHAKHHHQTHRSATVHSSHPKPHHHGKAEHLETMAPHEHKNHPHHESPLRGAAKKVKAEAEPAKEEVEHVSGKEFVPKKSAGASSELKSEVWTPPKRKHHRAALLQGDANSDRYDAWCDSLYVKGGGLIDERDRNTKPSSSLPKKA